MKKIILLFLLFIFSFSFCEGQKWLWGTQGTVASGNSSGEGCDITTDRYGNVFVGGNVYGNVHVGIYSLSSSINYTSAYLIKYKSDGTVLWAKQSMNFSPNGQGFEHSISADISGNIYAAGAASNIITFGVDTVHGNSNLGYTNSFLTKYDSNGNVIWVQQSKGNASNCSATGYGACIDNNKNIYLTGGFDQIEYFDTQLLSNPVPTAFLVKYDSSGNVIWAKQSKSSPGTSTGVGSKVVTDSRGNIYVAGGFSDSIRFENDSLSTVCGISGGDIFLAKYNSTGNVLWVTQANVYTPSAFASIYGFAIDKNSNTYITGQFMDSVSFGPIKLISTSASPYDIFIVKYDSNGNPIWAKTAQTYYGAFWSCYSIAPDTNGNIYVSLGGGGAGPNYAIKYGTRVFSVPGVVYDGASVIMKLDTSGKLLCGNIVGGGGDDWNGVACNLAGNCVYFGGDFWANAVFGKDTLSLLASEVPFLAKWLPCGEVITSDNTNQNVDLPSLSIFPNPSSGKFTIQLSGVSGKSSVEIYNVMGQRVTIATLKQVQGDYKIDLTSQPNGIYLYRVISEEGNLLGDGKFVITH